MSAPADPGERRRMRTVVARLARAHPDARLALEFSCPFELLVALILAAQCTDERVNALTGTLLFRKYATPEDYVRVPASDLEADIRPTGFYRNKARALQQCSRHLVERFGSQVPDRLEELLTLPGVGRKTANILLGNAFGRQAIGVDTHVLRLAQRLGFTRQTDPDKVEADLVAVVPAGVQTRFCHLMQAHGRRVCLARTPQCPTCVVRDLCPYPHKTLATRPRRPRPAFGRDPRQPPPAAEET